MYPSDQGALVLATGNTHKTKELSALLRSVPLTTLDLTRMQNVPHIEETGDTLRDNAALKARTIRDFTGLATLADDTGLEVTTLGGAPGIRSARYAGPRADARANRAKLLQALEGQSTREARFVTVLALALGSDMYFFEGQCAGHIAFHEMTPGGFGYESIFVPKGFDVSFAQLSTEQKNAISHRGHAGQKLVAFLRQCGVPAS